MFFKRDTMKSKTVIWIFVSLLSVLLVAGSITYILLQKFIESESIEVTQKISGQTDWEAQKSKSENKKQEIQLLGLTDIYETVSVHDDTRQRLYEDQDFDLVTQRLQAQYSSIDTPLDGTYYSGHITQIGGFEYDESPEEHLSILNRWVRTSPDAFYPYL